MTVMPRNALRRPRYGFTLIELLVVIAIISLLVSILLPSLTKAKELAMSVACQSNLRSIGISLLLYAEDSEGLVFLLGKEFSGQYHYWSEPLYEDGYIDARDVLQCPSLEPKTFVSPGATYGARDRFQTRTEYKKFITNPGGDAEWYLRVNAIESPVDYLQIVDSSWDPPYHAQCCHIVGGKSIDLRHNGLANAWFIDGHLEGCDTTRIETSMIDTGGATIPISVIEDGLYFLLN